MALESADVAGPSREQQRTSTDGDISSLATRIQSFFAFSAPPLPQSPPDSGDVPESSTTISLDDDSEPPSLSMRPPCASGSPKLSQRTLYSSSKPSHSPRSGSMNLNRPSPSAADLSAAQKRKRASQPALPILRWFSAKQPGKPSRSLPNSPVRSRPPTPAANQSDSPGPSSPSTPLSALSSLHDAFSDDPHISAAHSRSNSDDVKLPSRPQAARLPTALPRPSYFSNLTRSTLPTACLSPPSSASYVRAAYTDPFENPFPQQFDHDRSDLDLFFSPTPVPLPMPHSPAPAHLNSSPPEGSSVESLRTIHERSRTIHTTASQQTFAFPQLPSLQSWFSPKDSSDKNDVHSLLSEEDQAENTEAEREHIRQKCAYLPVPSFLCDANAVPGFPDVATKNPLVFCHGLLGFDTVTLGPQIAPLQVQHWRGIRDALEANGIEVRLPVRDTCSHTTHGMFYRS